MLPTIEYAYTSLVVEDVKRATAFYVQAFGFTLDHAHDEWDYAELHTGPTRIAFVAPSLGPAGDNAAVALPLVVVVSGYDPVTKTVAQAIARAIPCPAILRDEIKEGLVHPEDEYTPAPGDPMNRRTAETLFGVVRFLVDAGATLVAEASYQHGLWEQGLRPLLDRARVRVVHCRVDPLAAWERMARRADEAPERRAIHGDYSLLEPFETFKAKLESFQPVALGVPPIEIDTTDGYDPSIEEVVALLNRP